MPPSLVLSSRSSAALASASALSIFQRHWPDYCREAAGLAGFVLCAGGFASLLQYPGLPANEAIASAPLGRFAGLLLAALIGLYIAIESPLSGMSLNPAHSFGAPPLAMLLATELYRGVCPASIATLPHYPVPAEKP